MKIRKFVSTLFLTLIIGLLLSGCSHGTVTESIKTTPKKSIIQGEGRYNYFVIIKGKYGKLVGYPINIPYPQVEKPNKGGKK